MIQHKTNTSVSILKSIKYYYYIYKPFSHINLSLYYMKPKKRKSYISKYYATLLWYCIRQKKKTVLIPRIEQVGVKPTR